VSVHEPGINNMEGFFPALDTFSDEWQQDSIFFIGRMKESADVALWSERGVGEMNRLFSSSHRVPPYLSVAVENFRPKLMTPTWEGLMERLPTHCNDEGPSNIRMPRWDA
jgi:hypothetical protein